MWYGGKIPYPRSRTWWFLLNSAGSSLSNSKQVPPSWASVSPFVKWGLRWDCFNELSSLWMLEKWCLTPSRRRECDVCLCHDLLLASPLAFNQPWGLGLEWGHQTMDFELETSESLWSALVVTEILRLFWGLFTAQHQLLEDVSKHLLTHNRRLMNAFWIDEWAHGVGWEQILFHHSLFSHSLFTEWLLCARTCTYTLKMRQDQDPALLESTF